MIYANAGTVVRPKTFYDGAPINVMDAGQLTSYLSSFNTEEERAMQNLWQTYAARKELAGGGGRIRYRMGADMQYYRTIGSKETVVPYNSIKTDMIRFAKGVQVEQRSISSNLIRGNISGQQWYDETVRTAKLSYGAAFQTTRLNNSEPMDDDERRRWLETIIIILLLLNNTAEMISQKQRPLDGTFLLNADGLSNSLIGSPENWRTQVALRQGFTQGRRRLGFAEHCHTEGDRTGCVELADRGWVPLYTVVRIGMASCYWNCKCIIQYR